MGGKDSFQVGNKYLKNSNYYVPLNDDYYIAAYQERILIGKVEDFDGDNAKFNKKSIVIPSNVYFEFVDCIRKACQSFKDQTSEAWEVIL